MTKMTSTNNTKHSPVKRESPEAMPKFAIGQKVRKWFDGSGWFTGKISSYDGVYYDVVYSDGDSEEYDKDELEAIVLSPELEQVQVGMRVAVYKSQEDQYYEAVVSRERIDKKPLLLVYSNGNREWLDLRQCSFVLLEGQPGRRTRRGSDRDEMETQDTSSDGAEFVNREETSRSDLPRAKTPLEKFDENDVVEAPTPVHSMNIRSDVKSEPDSKPSADICSKRNVVTSTPTKSPAGLSNASAHGARRNVKSEPEPESKQKRDRKSKRNHALTQPQLNTKVEDEESPDVNKVEVGSRVAVYRPDNNHFQEAVVTQRRYIKKPFYLEYTNGNAEWVDLRRCNFRLLEEPTLPRRARRRQTPEKENQSDTPMLARENEKKKRRHTEIKGKTAESVCDEKRNQVSINGELDASRSREKKRHRHLEIKGKAAESVCDEKRNQVSINGELGASGMLEPSEHGIADKSSACNEAGKGDKSTQGKRGKPKYEIGTKVKKYFEGHGWFIGEVTSYEEPYYCVLYEDGDREEYKEKDLLDVLLTPDLAKVSVGSRVAIHWPDDDDYYEATVITEYNWCKTPYEVEYDSGHFELIDFRKVKFCVLASGTRRRSETVIESDTDDEA